MFITESPTIKLSPINKSGWCFNCHRFRHCKHQSLAESKIICADCVQMLKNQGLIEITQPIIQTVEEKKVKKVREKPVREKTVKEKKIRIGRYPRKVLNLIKESDKALTASEIIKNTCGHKNTIYKVINQLISSGDIVGSDKTKDRLFIDKDRADLLQVKRDREIKQRRTKTPEKILNYIRKQNRILTCFDVAKGISINKKTVIRTVRLLEERGVISLIRIFEKGGSFYFAASDNPQLVQQLTEVDQQSTASQVRKFLESNTGGVSIGDALVAIGKKRRNGGSYNYIKKLFEQWGCETYKKGYGLYYYLPTTTTPGGV